MPQPQVPDFVATAAAELSIDPKSRSIAGYLDSHDALSHLRQEFCIPKKGTLPEADASLINPEEESIYLCGNSLGLMPKAIRRITDEQLGKWGDMGVFGHFYAPLPWSRIDEACVDQVAGLVGAHADEVSLMNSLTVNIHALFAAFYKPDGERKKVVIEAKAFPSDHYAVESQIKLRGYDPADCMVCLEPRAGEDTLRTEDILDYISREGHTVAILFLSGIQYYTGQLFDIPKITAAGKAAGCLVGWDLAHAFANVPLKLHDWDVDFAAWCTYKYGSSGPGGIGGAFVHRRWATDNRTRLTGWWGHRAETRFVMSNDLDLAPGASGYRISTPPAFLAVGLLGALEVFAKTTLTDLRAKSIKLTAYLEYLIDVHLAEPLANGVKCEIMTPRNPEERGCQLSLKFNVDIGAVYRALVARGIAVDKRYPYVIRVAPVHLYNSFDDVWRFVEELCNALAAV